MNDILRPWRRLRDGDRTWGSLRVYDTYYGVTRYLLAVFPPGISTAERRRLRAWRLFPAWGAALFLIANLTLGQTSTPGTALLYSAVLVVAAGTVACWQAGPSRRAVRTLAVVSMRGLDDADIDRARRHLERLAIELVKADDQLADGAIDAVAHEAVVWRVYDRMAGRRDNTAATA